MFQRGLRSRSIEQLRCPEPIQAQRWLCYGYVARGRVTFLTGRHLTGQMTLTLGMLRQMETGGKFLDLDCAPAKVLIISSEPCWRWLARTRKMPVGPHVRFILEPFPGPPTVPGWHEIIEHANGLCEAGDLDLIAVDHLSRLLPKHGCCDPHLIQEILQPLRQLTTRDVGLLLMDHPHSKALSSYRAAGITSGFADIDLQLLRYGSTRTNDCRRKIVALAGRPETPGQLVYEFRPQQREFVNLGDPSATRFDAGWRLVEMMLKARTGALTHHELLKRFRRKRRLPASSVLYEWLNRAVRENRLMREGTGRRNSPFRYRLPRAEDQSMRTAES
jgi:AAA domain